MNNWGLRFVLDFAPSNRDGLSFALSVIRYGLGTSQVLGPVRSTLGSETPNLLRTHTEMHAGGVDNFL